jgi:hypothetical protein
VVFFFFPSSSQEKSAKKKFLQVQGKVLAEFSNHHVLTGNPEEEYKQSVLRPRPPPAQRSGRRTEGREKEKGERNSSSGKAGAEKCAPLQPSFFLFFRFFFTPPLLHPAALQR